jgi:hypothetical protein
MKRLLGLTALLSLGWAAQAGAADKPMPAMPGMPGMSMSEMENGSHDMPSTVTAVNHATGVINVTSEGMAMRLHFPPASLKTIKPGDEIVLHLGFTKP